MDMLVKKFIQTGFSYKEHIEEDLAMNKRKETSKFKTSLAYTEIMTSKNPETIDYNDSYVSDDNYLDDKNGKNKIAGLHFKKFKKNIKKKPASQSKAENLLPVKVMSKSSTNFNVNQRIIQKFYMPYIEKKSYNTKLNTGILQIKQQTRNSTIYSHYLNKKKKEIDGIKRELIIYNNPSKIYLFLSLKKLIWTLYLLTLIILMLDI
jgi:ribosomal protein L33